MSESKIQMSLLACPKQGGGSSQTGEKYSGSPNRLRRQTVKLSLDEALALVLKEDEPVLRRLAD